MDIQTVEEMLKVIETIIQLKVDPSNPDEIVGHLNEICAIQANASYCQAEAQRLLADQMAELVMMPIYGGLSATDKKILFAGKCRDLNFLVTYAERLSRSISHKIDALRSMLSFLKMEMEQSKFQTH